MKLLLLIYDFKMILSDHTLECMVLPRIDDTWPSAKVSFTYTGNLHCMPQGHVMHVPSISEGHLGQETRIWNPRENLRNLPLLSNNPMTSNTRLVGTQYWYNYNPAHQLPRNTIQSDSQVISPSHFLSGGHCLPKAFVSCTWKIHKIHKTKSQSSSFKLLFEHTWYNNNNQCVQCRLISPIVSGDWKNSI